MMFSKKLLNGSKFQLNKNKSLPQAAKGFYF